MTKVLGIDVGGTYTRFGVVTNKFVSSVEKLFTKDIENFPLFIRELVEKNKDIEVISIGIPGIVKNNKIISIPNLKSLEVRDLDERIYELTRKKVIINKDVNLLFANDLDRLNLSYQANVLGFYIGTGLGNALKINGKTHKGINGFAGELGHIPIIGNEKICGCGKVGCSETLVSGKALVELHEEYKLSGDIKDIFVEHINNPLIQEFIRNLGSLLSFEINTLDILKLVIGGGVINMEGFPKDDLRDLLKGHLRSECLAKELEIYFVDDSPVNSIIGAALVIEE
jgi:allose kinase